jgi:hypothetical protein
MKTGDTVKVRIRKAFYDKDGKQTIPELWHVGKILGISGTVGFSNSVKYRIGHGEHSSYIEENFPVTEILKYEPLSEEQHAEDIARELPKGLEHAKDLLKVLMADETVELKDESLIGYHGAISIDPTYIDSKRIGSLVEITGWEVTIWTETHATRWNPSEKIDTHVETFRSIKQAVEKMINVIFSMRMADYLANKAEQEQEIAWSQESLV